jgi:hypothetical protein
MRAFDLDEMEVSEHDILHGGVLALAARQGFGGAQGGLEGESK